MLPNELPDEPSGESADELQSSWDLLMPHYLDGELSCEEEADFLLAVQESPNLQRRFAHAKTIHEALQNIAHQATYWLDDTDKTPSLWTAIANQLHEDAVADPVGDIWALETASAYHDGELSPEEREQFEAQLHQQLFLNQLLADFETLSESISQGVSSCEVDVSAEVLHRLMTDNSEDTMQPLLPSGLTLVQVELLSAHTDDALKAQDIIAVNRLIESDMQARHSLQQFHSLHETLQQASIQWQAQAPVIAWREIQDQLLKDPVFMAEAYQQRSRKQAAQFKKAIWLGAPMAAAAALLLLSWPALQMNELLGFSLPLEARPEGSKLATIAPAQIASLPRIGRGALSHLSSSGESAPPLPAFTVFDGKPHRMIVPTHPVLDPAVRQLAVRQQSGSRSDVPNSGSKHGRKSPSSEEYLFHALEEEGSGAELSTLLGD
jgi:anti-sigma factor RsiW